MQAKTLGIALFIAVLTGAAISSPWAEARPRAKRPVLRHSSWTIDIADVKNAPCMRDQVFSEKEMTTWLQSWAQKDRHATRSAKVAGVQFHNEYPELLRLFRDLVTPKTLDSTGVRPPLWVSLTCTRVLCAAEQIFGKKVGLQLLYMLARYGVNGSHLGNPASSPWRASELDEVLLAFSAYPDSLNKNLYGMPFIHRERNFDSGNQLGYASGIFSAWNRQSRGDRFITIAHERAHHFAEIEKVPAPGDYTGFAFLSLDTTPEWYGLSGWTSEDPNPGSLDIGPFRLAHPERVPSLYGRTRPPEDFAESVLKYRFDARGFLQRLGKRGRAKYDYLRDRVFNGVEFLSEDTCREAFESQLPPPEEAASLSTSVMEVPTFQFNVPFHAEPSPETGAYSAR